MFTRAAGGVKGRGGEGFLGEGGEEYEGEEGEEETEGVELEDGELDQEDS